MATNTPTRGGRWKVGPVRSDGERAAAGPRIFRKRRSKLVNPALQLRLVFVFAGISLLSLLLQALFFMSRLSAQASTMTEGGDVLITALPSLLLETLLVSACVFLPLLLAVGVLTTFRIAGPLYRFQQFLEAVRDGAQSAPCRLRRDDELQDLCTLINEVTAPLREGRHTQGTASETRSRAS